MSSPSDDDKAGTFLLGLMLGALIALGWLGLILYAFRFP